MSKYVFFWQPHGPNGIYSQWYPCQFKDNTGIIYNSVEHFILHQKALLAQDTILANDILHTRIEDLPKLKRQIPKSDVWRWYRETVLFTANYYKFSQNPRLKKELLRHANKTFIKASPIDQINGIGYPANLALITRPKWGANLFGKSLNQVADCLKT